MYTQREPWGKANVGQGSGSRRPGCTGQCSIANSPGTEGQHAALVAGSVAKEASWRGASGQRLFFTQHGSIFVFHQSVQLSPPACQSWVRVGRRAGGGGWGHCQGLAFRGWACAPLPTLNRPTMRSSSLDPSSSSPVLPRSRLKVCSQSSKLSNSDSSSLGYT